MARAEHEEFQLYCSRIRPIYHQLFNLAHAVTGNREAAQYCLQYAILDCWSVGENGASSHGFRESLRSSVIRAGLRHEPAPEGEFDWNGLTADPENADPLLRAVAQEGVDLRRMLALRYGCSLSVRRIARVLNCEKNRVQTMLRRFEARTCRKLSAADRRRYDLLMARMIRGRLSLPSPLAPEMGSVFRAFQADAASVSRPSRLPARILRTVVALVLALFCMAAFWLAAVLMQPPVLEKNNEPAISETLSD